MTVTVENEINVSGLCPRNWSSLGDYGSEKAYALEGSDKVFGVGLLSKLQAGYAGLREFNDKRSSGLDFSVGPLWCDEPLDENQNAMLAGAGASEAVLIGQDVRVGLEIISRRKTTAIVLTGNKAISDRWAEGFSNLLQVDAGTIEKPWHITLATIDEVCSKLEKNEEGKKPWSFLGCDPGLVVVDGADLVSIDQLRKAVRAFRPRYRCGFVEQDISKTVKLMLLCHELGPLVYSSAWGGNLFDHPSKFNWSL